MESQLAPLIDLIELGKRVKAARVLAGHETVKAGAEFLRSSLGVQMSDRTLYSIERGTAMPNLEQVVAIIFGFRPPGYSAFFVPCLREDVLRLSFETLEEQFAFRRLDEKVHMDVTH